MQTWARTIVAYLAVIASSFGQAKLNDKTQTKPEDCKKLFSKVEAYSKEKGAKTSPEIATFENLDSFLISTARRSIHLDKAARLPLKSTKRFYFRGMLLTPEGLADFLKRGMRPKESPFQRLFFSKYAWGADIYTGSPALVRNKNPPSRMLRVIFQIDPAKLKIAPKKPVDMLEVFKTLSKSDFTEVWIYSPMDSKYHTFAIPGR